MAPLQYDATLSRSQFAAAALADEKWVENAARAVGRTLTYSPEEARWMGMVRLLVRALSIPVARASELADEALSHSPHTRALSLAQSADGVATLIVDLARYHSTFAAALSAALNHGGPRRRGRPSAQPHSGGRRAVVRAEAYGVDISLVREALGQTPAERLARLDSNAGFIRALRRASSEK